MNKDKYACLGCGFVYEDNTTTKRVDRAYQRSRARMDSSVPAFHGIVKYRQCPKCSTQYIIENIPD